MDEARLHRPARERSSNCNHLLLLSTQALQISRFNWSHLSLRMLATQKYLGTGFQDHGIIYKLRNVLLSRLLSGWCSPVKRNVDDQQIDTLEIGPASKLFHGWRDHGLLVKSNPDLDNVSNLKSAERDGLRVLLDMGTGAVYLKLLQPLDTSAEAPSGGFFGRTWNLEERPDHFQRQPRLRDIALAVLSLFQTNRQ
jgi:hypothetical protein